MDVSNRTLAGWERLANLLVPPSLDLRRLDLRREESRGTCWGDVSAEEPEFGLSMSALPRRLDRDGAADPVDITAAAARLPRFGTASTGVGAVSGSASGSVVSGSVVPRGRLVLRCSRAVGGVGSVVAALRLRGAGVARVGGVPKVVGSAGGSCWVVVAGEVAVLLDEAAEVRAAVLLLSTESACSLAVAERVTRWL